MATRIGQGRTNLSLEALADNLKSAVETFGILKAIYRHWDRETHLSPQGEFLGSRQSPGEITLEQSFLRTCSAANPNSISEERSRQALVLSMVRRVRQHRVESIPEERFQWYLGRGNVTSERVYQSVEHIQISVLKEKIK